MYIYIERERENRGREERKIYIYRERERGTERKNCLFTNIFACSGDNKHVYLPAQRQNVMYTNTYTFQPRTRKCVPRGSGAAGPAPPTTTLCGRSCCGAPPPRPPCAMPAPRLSRSAWHSIAYHVRLHQTDYKVCWENVAITLFANVQLGMAMQIDFTQSHLHVNVISKL